MEKGKFGFILHPTDIGHVHRRWGFTRKLPDSWVEGAIKFLPPKLLSYHDGVRSPHNQAEGWIIATVLTARQMVRLPEQYVLRKIIDAGRAAERLGAKIIGLGAYTAIVGDAGLTIAKNLRAAVTTGNTYTVAAALEGAKEGARRMGVDYRRAEIAIVGATGAIGAACTHVLAREARSLTLIGRDEPRLERLARRVTDETGLTAKISTNVKKVLPKADIVITVSSSVDTIIESADLKPGAVVCDVALPRDVDERVTRERDDVLVIDGGVISVPSDLAFNFGHGFSPGTSPACLAETMILALENRYENFTLGRDVTVRQVDEITRLAKKHGFKLAGMRSFHRPLDEAAIERVRQNARRRLAVGLGQVQTV